MASSVTLTRDWSKRPWHRGPVVGRPELVSVRPPRWRLPVALAALLAVFAFTTWVMVDSLGTRATVVDLPRIDVPIVEGLPETAALTQLEELGFVVDIQRLPNEVVPAGTALSTRPVANAKVQQGDLVTLIVSDGPAGVTVPDVIGQQVADAQALLTSSGLGAPFQLVYDENAKVGQVLTTDPPPGKRVPLQGTVTLIVSQGPAPRTVPDLVNQDLNGALVALGRSGLGVGTITRTYKKDQPVGVVLSTDPPPGSQVARDYPVKITATGPPPEITVPTMTGLLESSARTVAQARGVPVTVVTQVLPVGDPRIGRVVAQGIPPFAKVPPGTSVQLTIGVAG
jgi:beta-lactam-binding protein with PASTA domain